MLIALREAGLDTMPGGGAETFSAAVREQIAGKKLAGADYIGVHRTAHELGIRTNCTMLYGHVETHRRTASSICRCSATCRMKRAAFSPTSHSRTILTTTCSARNSGAKEPRRAASTISRCSPLGGLFLDNFKHIKSHWIMVSQPLSQLSLHFGVNDLEGTVVREKIYHAVGAHTPQGMTLDGLLKLIRGAGKMPAERDSFYNIVATCSTERPRRRA